MVKTKTVQFYGARVRVKVDIVSETVLEATVLWPEWLEIEDLTGAVGGNLDDLHTELFEAATGLQVAS